MQDSKVMIENSSTGYIIERNKHFLARISA